VCGKIHSNTFNNILWLQLAYNVIFFCNFHNYTFPYRKLSNEGIMNIYEDYVVISEFLWLNNKSKFILGGQPRFLVQWLGVNIYFRSGGWEIHSSLIVPIQRAFLTQVSWLPARWLWQSHRDWVELARSVGWSLTTSTHMTIETFERRPLCSALERQGQTKTYLIMKDSFLYPFPF
jgi:hypothetical protein